MAFYDKLLKDDTELQITLDVNKKNKTLTVSDNGIGMTYEEVESQLGKPLAIERGVNHFEIHNNITPHKKAI